MEILRPLWLALLLTFWALYMPHTVGMVTAFCLGLAEDVLLGRRCSGQNALILTLITFLVLSLQQRLRMFPMWQQCLVILVIFGLAQLVQLWLSALTGNRQPTLALVLAGTGQRLALALGQLCPARIAPTLQNQLSR